MPCAALVGVLGAQVAVMGIGVVGGGLALSGRTLELPWVGRWVEGWLLDEA